MYHTKVLISMKDIQQGKYHVKRIPCKYPTWLDKSLKIILENILPRRY